MDGKAELRELVALLTELRRRFQEFSETRIFDPDGYGDFVKLSERVNELCQQNQLPEMIRCKIRPANKSNFTRDLQGTGYVKEFLRIVIRDPMTGKGRVTALPHAWFNADGSMPDYSHEIKMLDDFFRRSIAYVQIETERQLQLNNGSDKVKASLPALLMELQERLLRVGQPTWKVGPWQDILELMEEISRQCKERWNRKSIQLSLYSRSPFGESLVYHAWDPITTDSQMGAIPISEKFAYVRVLTLPVFLDFVGRWERFARSNENELGILTVKQEQVIETKSRPIIAEFANNETSYQKLLSAYTNGTSNEKLKQMAVVIDGTGTVDQKTSELDKLLPLVSLSADTISNLLGCTKQAVFKTTYWKKNRKGKRDEESETRRQRMTERGNRFETGNADD